MAIEDRSDDYQKLYELFRRAELASKNVETASRIEGVGVACINELRYVGQHLCKHLAGKGEPDEIVKAVRHAKRAIYDAYEGGILGSRDYFGDFIDMYGAMTELREQVPDYDTIVESYDDAMQLIDNVREDSHNRDAFYEKIRPHWDSVMLLQRRLERVKPVLAQCLEEKKRTGLKWYIGIGVPLFGIAVGATFKIISMVVGCCASK